MRLLGNCGRELGRDDRTDRPRLRRHVADVADAARSVASTRSSTAPHARLLEDLALNGILERLCRLDEPGETRVEALGPGALPSEQDPVAGRVNDGGNAH